MLFLIRACCPPLSSGWPSSQATRYFLPALFSPILSLRITWRHPAQSHRGLRTPSPTRWALGQASLPFLNWSGGICAHPSTQSSCQQWSPALSCPLPPFLLELLELLSLLSPPPRTFRATAVWSGHGPILSQGCLCRASGSNWPDTLLVEKSDFPFQLFSTDRELSPVHLRVRWPSKLRAGWQGIRQLKSI